jgi:hypothetical protein
VTDRDIAEAGTILRVLAGSTVHGTAVPGSDRDEMGIAIPPREYVMGLRTFEQWVYRTAVDGARSGVEDTEGTIYDLRKWTRLAAAGNPSMLLPLFVNGPCLLTVEPEGHQLRAHAGLFVSKHAGHRFLGYLQSQRQKLLGERGNRTNRPELVAEHGYDSKFAYHAVRLGYQGVEFLTTGRLQLPMPEPIRVVLLAIRGGGYTLTDVVDAIAGYEAALGQLVSDANTAIPRMADMGAASRLMVDLHESWWARHSGRNPDAPA